MKAVVGTGQEKEEKVEDRSLLILYGTETGHSQEIAEEIGDAAERLRFRTTIGQMNDVSLKELGQYSFTVFVISTTGQGDVPANAAAFWKSLLRKKLPPACLSQLQFTIFGLGDSSYPKFNWAARKLQKRLLQLGAVEFYQIGEGDERHDNGIDSIYVPWFQALKNQVLNRFPLPDGILPIPDEELLSPKYPIHVGAMSAQDSSVGDSGGAPGDEKSAALSHIERPKSTAEQLDDDYDRRVDFNGFGYYLRESERMTEKFTFGGSLKPDEDNILKDHLQKYNMEPSVSEELELPPRKFIPVPGTYDSTVLSIKRVTPENHWQDVRLLKIQMFNTNWNSTPLPCLQPGDTVQIYPKNFPADVQALIDMMEWQSIADEKVCWRSKKGRPQCPRNLHPVADATLREILLHNLDITAVPNRTFLKQLRRHTRSELEQERLLELTQESNTQEFYDYTSRPRRTILEVLQDFPGVKIPVEYALETFPVIRPRAFSIANSARDHQDPDGDHRVVEILVALVEYKTIIRKPRQGLCSRYIKSLSADWSLAVGLDRANSPPNGNQACRRPLLAIATGTGIAPIRSLIQERACWAPLDAPTLLFFGCRNRDTDYYFQNEWEHRYGNKVEVIPAFSRDPIDRADQASLDPYAEQAKNVLPPQISIGNRAAPIGPQNTPWTRSFDYDRGKMYVQHRIRRYADKICDLIKDGLDLDQKPIIMICGNAGRMPISVRLALEDAIVIGGLAKDNENAKRAVQEFLWMETW